MITDRQLAAWLVHALDPPEREAVEHALQDVGIQARLAWIRQQLDAQPQPSSWAFPPVGFGAEAMGATSVLLLGQRRIDVHLTEQKHEGCWLILQIATEVSLVFPRLPETDGLTAERPRDLRLSVDDRAERMVAVLVPPDWLTLAWPELAVRLQTTRPPCPTWVLPIDPPSGEPHDVSIP